MRMMNLPHFFSVFIICNIGLACISPSKASKMKGTQGISGSVKELSGNQMPGPGVKRPEPQGLRTTLYVYELTTLNGVERDGEAPLYKAIHTRLVDSVGTDDAGKFALTLPVGQYSLFARVNGMYFANLFDANNNIFPVTVEKDKVTPVDFVVNINATY